MSRTRLVVDHLTIHVADLAASRWFYVAALAPLGFRPVVEADDEIGFGDPGDDFYIRRADPVHTGVHVAFLAPERAAVDAFHAAGLAAGGRDNGGPGPRPQYHDSYYAAYLLDPDGNNVEAVHHGRGRTVEAPGG